MKSNRIYIIILLLLICSLQVNAADFKGMFIGEGETVSIISAKVSIHDSLTLSKGSKVIIKLDAAADSASLTAVGRTNIISAAFTAEGKNTLVRTNSIEYTGATASTIDITGARIITNYICRNLANSSALADVKLSDAVIEITDVAPVPAFPAGRAYFDIGNTSSNMTWTGGVISLDKGYAEPEYSVLINVNDIAPHGGTLLLRPKESLTDQFYKVQSTVKIDSLILGTPTLAGMSKNPILSVTAPVSVRELSLTSAGNGRFVYNDSVFVSGNFDNNLQYRGITATTDKSFLVFNGTANQDIKNTVSNNDNFLFKNVAVKNNNRVIVAKDTDIDTTGLLYLEEGALYIGTKHLFMCVDAKTYKRTSGVLSNDIRQFSQGTSVIQHPDGQMIYDFKKGGFAADEHYVYPTAVENNGLQLLASKAIFKGDNVPYVDTNLRMSIIPVQGVHLRAVDMDSKLDVYWRLRYGAIETDSSKVSHLFDSTRSTNVSLEFYATDVTNADKLQKCVVAGNFLIKSTSGGDTYGTPYWATNPGTANNVDVGSDAVYFASEGVKFRNEFRNIYPYTGWQTVSFGTGNASDLVNHVNNDSTYTYKKIKMLLHNTEWTLLRRVFYSRRDGDWTDVNTWTFNPTHVGPSVATDGHFPGKMQMAGLWNNNGKTTSWQKRNPDAISTAAGVYNIRQGLWINDPDPDWRQLPTDLDSVVISSAHQVRVRKSVVVSPNINTSGTVTIDGDIPAIAYVSVGTTQNVAASDYELSIPASGDTTGVLLLEMPLFSNTKFPVALKQDTTHEVPAVEALPDTRFVLRDHSTLQVGGGLASSIVSDALTQNKMGDTTRFYGYVRTGAREFSKRATYIYRTYTNWGAGIYAGNALPDTVKNLLLRGSSLNGGGGNINIDGCYLNFKRNASAPDSVNHKLTVLDTLSIEGGCITSLKYLEVGKALLAGGRTNLFYSSTYDTPKLTDLYFRTQTGVSGVTASPEKYFVIDNENGITLPGNLHTRGGNTTIKRTDARIFEPNCDLKMQRIATADALPKLNFEDPANIKSHFVLSNMLSLRLIGDRSAYNATYGSNLDQIVLTENLTSKKIGDNHYVATSVNSGSLFIELLTVDSTALSANSNCNNSMDSYAAATKEWVWPIGSFGSADDHYSGVQLLAIQKGTSTPPWNLGFRNAYGKGPDGRHSAMPDTTSQYFSKYFSILSDKSYAGIMFYMTYVVNSSLPIFSLSNAGIYAKIFMSQDVYETPTSSGSFIVDAFRSYKNNPKTPFWVTDTTKTVLKNFLTFGLHPNERIGNLGFVQIASCLTGQLPLAFDIYYGGKDESVIPKQFFWYSVKNGDWNDPTTWTRNKDHVTPDNPANVVPNTGIETVFLANGHEVLTNIPAHVDKVVLGYADAVPALKTATLKIPNGFNVSGSTFSMYDTSTIVIGDPAGISSNISLGSIRMPLHAYSKKGNYIYNAGVAQSSGDAIPDSVGALVIDANTRLALSKSTSPEYLVDIKDNCSLDMGENHLLNAAFYKKVTTSNYTSIQGDFKMGRGSYLYIGGRNNFKNVLEGYRRYHFAFPEYISDEDDSEGSTVVFNGTTQVISEVPYAGPGFPYPWTGHVPADPSYSAKAVHYDNLGQYPRTHEDLALGKFYSNNWFWQKEMRGLDNGSHLTGNLNYRHYYPIKYPDNPYNINMENSTVPQYIYQGSQAMRDTMNYWYTHAATGFNGSSDNRIMPNVPAQAKDINMLTPDTWRSAHKFELEVFDVPIKLTNINVGFPRVKVIGGEKIISDNMVVLRNLEVEANTTLTVDLGLNRRFKIYKNLINAGHIVNRGSVIEIGN